MPAFRNRVDRLAEEAGFYKLSNLILHHHTELILARARDAMSRRLAK